jgi:hypothetical protein
MMLINNFFNYDLVVYQSKNNIIARMVFVNESLFALQLLSIF